jgi:hypothetical protein
MGMEEGVSIASRFRGPPDSANGGYACGCIAQVVGEPVQVTLRRPPPMEKVLVVRDGNLVDGDVVIATAERIALVLDVPEPVSFAEAEDCAGRYIGHAHHLVPGCFVCGPGRAAGDGLRIFPGRVASGQFAAAPWIPDASLCDERGEVHREVLWASLDCPGYFGAMDSMEMALLGRMAGAIDRPVRVGERCVTMGWLLGREGRKVHAGSALWNEAGDLVGRSRQTWILL